MVCGYIFYSENPANSGSDNGRKMSIHPPTP